MGGMIVEDQLDRRAGWIGGVEQLQGTSNNGAFFVGSTAAAARRSFFALDLA